VLVYEPDDETQMRLNGSLYVVADGHGAGMRGGAASRYAAHKIVAEYYDNPEPDLGLRLRQAIQAANADLYEYASAQPELVKLGTTVVAAAIRGEQMHVAAVGDSRAYYIRDGDLHRVTRDHTLVQQLVDEGAIAPEEAREHPRRDVVLRTLGSQPEVEIDLYDLRLKPDDAILLCTDGLTEALRDDEIARVVANASPRQAAERLVQKVTDRGGVDNVTVVSTLSVPRVERPAAGGDETVRAGAVTPPVEPPDRQADVPAPPYETTVQSAPPYGVPADQPPGADRPQPPAQPDAETQVSQPTQASPPGYPIDPVTGLPPVPPQGQTGAPGQPPQQPYQPRIYQPPVQPQPQRRGVPVGLFAVVGMLAIALTALMVVILINPMGWQFPGGQQAADVTAEPPTEEAVGAVDLTQAAPTEPQVEAPSPTVEEPATEEQPTAQPTLAAAPPGMVVVEGGDFLRGVSDEEAEAATQACLEEATDNTVCYPEYFQDAQPVETVTISPFFIDLTEVTNQAYAECVAAGACSAPENTEFYDDPAFGQHPVVYVNYEQATQYCQWAGKRLPTEAEWEKAARWDEAAQESYIWPWGDEWEPGRANTEAAGLGGLSAVEAFARDLSPYGVLGMAGNASEWTQDWYFDSYEGLGTLNPARLGDQPLAEPFRVVHGGNFQALSAFSRAGHRYDVPPETAAAWVGFRCVQDANGETPAVEETPTTDETPTGEAATEETAAPTATEEAPTETPEAGS
jgi:serine/threonine protein phosphatase PrpC/formylglycine-generating enzyme required for sulfatase activity